MKRTIEANLDAWLIDANRKPLVLRGARQVGKTWLIRDLAARAKKNIIEINFEKNPSAKRYFDSNDPKKIINEIELALDCTASLSTTLLFLDEIQAAPEIFAKLRWFYEEMPELPIVAAGSLLEFVLHDHVFSMPVGRIKYLHIEPFTFPEYLAAHNQEALVSHLKAWCPGQEFSATLHQKASEWFERYSFVGGMPEAVKADSSGKSAQGCRECQLDLLATYRDDFSKYRGRLDTECLDALLVLIAHSLGKKFVYARAESGIKQHQAKQALELLARARVSHIVKFTSAHGLPLGGDAKDSFRKVILNDIGLLHALLKTPAGTSFPAWQNISAQIRGQIVEQLIGQQLRSMGPLSGDGPELYYWQREGGRPGEIDYLLQYGGKIIPVELKSGTSGSMKSLHQFMYDRQLGYALRFDQNPPSQFNVSVKTTQGDAVVYQLLSLPLYLAGFLSPLLTSQFDSMHSNSQILANIPRNLL